MQKNWQEYHCDGEEDGKKCNTTSDLLDGGAVANRKYLKGRGWSFRGKYCFCPDCTEA